MIGIGNALVRCMVIFGDDLSTQCNMQETVFLIVSIFK